MCVVSCIVYSVSLSTLCFIAQKHVHCTHTPVQRLHAFNIITVESQLEKYQHIPFWPHQNVILAVYFGDVLQYYGSRLVMFFCVFSTGLILRLQSSSFCVWRPLKNTISFLSVHTRIGELLYYCRLLKHDRCVFQ